MSRKRIPACIAALVGLTRICHGAGEQAVGEDTHCGIWARDTLTNGFCGLNDRLGDTGIEFGLGATSIYQQNVRGGISKHRRAGRQQRSQ